jgi:hypothetical protein
MTTTTGNDTSEKGFAPGKIQREEEDDVTAVS